MKLGDLAWYMKDNKVHSAEIQSIMTVENLHEDWNATDDQKKIWMPFGKAGVFYATIHGIYSYKVVYASKEDLLKSI